jgi:hypothetical protein
VWQRELVRFGLAKLKPEKRLDTCGRTFIEFCVNKVETASREEGSNIFAS